MIDAQGSLGTQFSPQYLNLQKSFCCDTGSLKIIRWVGCKPSVYKGNKTLFTSEDIALCAWFQEVDSYSFLTLELTAGGYAELEFKSELYFFMKTEWEKDSLIGSRNLEILTNKQGGLIGSLIPFYIESPSLEEYNTFCMRDIYSGNTNSLINGTVIVNNPSPYTVNLSILYAH
jgi:hypothetical protein